MAFTDPEIQEIKARLGYGSLTALARPYFDIALVFETVVQDNANDYGESQVRDVILPNLRALDESLAPSSLTTRMKALEAGAIKLNPDELKKLLALREVWLDELASTLNVERANGPGRRNTCEVG